jgi:two-component system, LytTR family, sensor histidine kinase AlgZ
MAVVGSTLRALVAPRRLVPIALVGVVLVLVQASYSRDPRAVLVPVAMTVGFVLLAPATWRLWLAPAPDSLAGMLAFASLGAAVIALTGALLPLALALGPTFLTDDGSLLVALVLYLAGGWGLGRDIELEQDLANTRLLAVGRHLDPHFLYNTLNAIAEWCREDAVQAEAAILRLSTLLQAVFAGLETRRWPLARELALVEDFVALHRVRDPGARSLAMGTAGLVDELQVPPLVLLQLVENAVKHGQRGTIELQVQAGSDLLVTVENPGPYRPRAPGRGLAMLRRRLELAYGRDARLELADLGERTRATLHLPRRPPR